MKKHLMIPTGLTLLLGSGCASGPTPIPEAQSADARLYVEKCGVCHAVPHPKRNSAAEWRHLVALMEQRMSERSLDPLTPEQRQQLLAYLQRNGR